VTGAYTNADDAYIGKLTRFVIQNDFNSLYPSIIRAFNISQQSRVYIGDDIEPYVNNSKYAILNLSDDKRCRYNEN
jgi:DNA polymerase elongation subunit (family B)